LREIESSSVLPATFEGEVEIGESKDDSSEMINTLSAQASEDLSKILTQDLSSDESSENDHVFESSIIKKEPVSCVLTTTTEKVKAQIKTQVLKEKAPKAKKVTKRKPKSKAVAIVPIVPEPTQLVVSLKRTSYERQRPTSIQVTPPEIPMGEPLLININRHLLRRTKFRLPSLPTPDDKPKTPFEMIKLRFAKFGTTSKAVKQEETTPIATPTAHVSSRKREREVSPAELEAPKIQHYEPKVNLCM